MKFDPIRRDSISTTLRNGTGLCQGEKMRNANKKAWSVHFVAQMQFRLVHLPEQKEDL
jgi:hypothetical protein